MKTLSILTASALLVAGLSTTAMAGDSFFRNSDANNDGVISMSEAQGIYNTLNIQLYNSADSNGDGWLDEGEFYSLGGLSAGLR